jgi:methionyl-tRNA formyltransferase
MNIVLLGHEDSASIEALDTLVKLRPDHSYQLFWSGGLVAPQESAPTLTALHIADQQRFDRYLQRPATSPVLREARTLSAPNSADGLNTLAHSNPELIVSVRYRRILKDEAIAIPEHGVLNLHSGILPEYRGVMATFWAMLAGEPEIGTTLHRIVDSGIDTGPVIGIQRQAVEYGASYLENVLGLYPDGCAAIAQAIDDIQATGTVTAQEQITGTGRYYRSPTEADALRFLEQGLTLAPVD